MKYQIFLRGRHSGGKKMWYALYRTETGECKWRSTGKRNKDEALQEVERWEAEDRQREGGTLGQLVCDFFVPGSCPYFAWKAEQGGIKTQTVYEHRKNLKKYILPAFGRRYPAAIAEAEVEDWLRTLSLSGSTKNGILNTYRIVMKELKRSRKVAEVPAFRRFARRSLRKDPLTRVEVVKLFPDTEAALAAVWRLEEKDPDGLTFGLLFRLMLHAGMRPGEGRAVSREQLYPAYHGVLIDRQLDSEQVVALPKKGSVEDRRERLVIVPARTMEMLLAYAEARGIEEGFLFRIEGHPIYKSHLEDRFAKGLEQAKVAVGERILVPYSLRYTFRNLTAGVIDPETIREMMGHRSIEMSDHYRRVHPEQFAALVPYQERVEAIWNPAAVISPGGGVSRRGGRKQV